METLTQVLDIAIQTITLEAKGLLQRDPRARIRESGEDFADQIHDIRAGLRSEVGELQGR